MINNTQPTQEISYPQLWRLSTAVQQACYNTAVTAYENASTDGLCHDGAWECALDAMRALDFQQIVNQALPD